MQNCVKISKIWATFNTFSHVHSSRLICVIFAESFMVAARPSEITRHSATMPFCANMRIQLICTRSWLSIKWKFEGYRQRVKNDTVDSNSMTYLVMAADTCHSKDNQLQAEHNNSSWINIKWSNSTWTVQTNQHSQPKLTKNSLGVPYSHGNKD